MKMLNSQSNILKTVIVALFLPLFSGCGKCDRIKSDDPFAKARCRIEQLMDRKNISSFQAAVAKDGKVIYEEAFGWANVEKQIRTTPETMHLVASISKPFTSTALMILAEQGQIDLHGPVNRYLGDTRLIAYQGEAEDATVARMLLHTAGLPYGYYICGDERPPEGIKTDRDILDLAGVLVSAPGTRYEYSNLGYGLFADVVHEAAGVTKKDFIQKEILEPLGLERTGFFNSRPPADMIATQNFEGKVLPIAFDEDGYTALYSTAGDLVRFGMFHLKAHLPDQEAILSDDGIDMLWQFHEGVEITTRRLAWDVQEDFGLETVQHGGGGPGIHNWLYMIPSENVVIAIMSNAQYGNNSSDPVLTELIAAAIADSGNKKFSPRSGRGYPRWPKLDPAAFSGSWSGHIKGPKGTCEAAVEFDSRGNPKLHIEGDSCSSGEWVPTSSRRPKRDLEKLLWRFDACIPYLYPYAIHDEVILTIWLEGDKLIGSASAAKEKDFGKGENYVLPQYLELTKTQSTR